VLHTTVGSSRCASAPGAAGGAAAPDTGAASISAGQTRRLASTSTRLSSASRSNTFAQPNEAPISAPNGAPNDSEQSRPETAIAIQVARRAGGAASPTSA